MVGAMNQLRLRDFDADALLSFGVVYGFGSCVMVCANASGNRVAAKRLALRTRCPATSVDRFVMRG